MGGCQTDDKKSTNQQTSCEGSTEAIQKANSKPILVKVFSPPPGCEIEIDEEVTVRVFLEKVAPKLGLHESDAPSLQMEFSEATLAHEQQLNTAGMCDESQCRVLGVEAALEKRKAKAEAAAESAPAVCGCAAATHCARVVHFFWSVLAHQLHICHPASKGGLDNVHCFGVVLLE